MTIAYGARSDVGKVRTNNEDSFFVDETAGIFIVADGMGGHHAGEVASKMAVDIIGKSVAAALQQDPATADKTQVMFGQADPALSETANRLVSGIRLANQVIFEASRNDAARQGMGTTVVALIVQQNTYRIAWVGDSRIYLLRHERLQQLTSDHSLVEEQVAKGLISPAEAERSAYKNVLTRALGTAAAVDVDAADLDAFADDCLLLCSDGLTRMVPDSRIAEIIAQHKNPADSCAALVDAALDAGGRDNVTAVVVQYTPDTFWGKLKKAVGK